MNDLEILARLETLGARTRNEDAPAGVWNLLDRLDANPAPAPRFRRIRLPGAVAAHRKTASALSGLAATIIIAGGLLLLTMPGTKPAWPASYSLPPIASWRLLATVDLPGAQPSFMTDLRSEGGYVLGFQSTIGSVGDAMGANECVLLTTKLVDWACNPIPEPIGALGLQPISTNATYSAVAVKDGRFVAVGYLEGVPDIVAQNDHTTPGPDLGLTWTSPDGVHWTERQTARIPGASIADVRPTAAGFVAAGGLSIRKGIPTATTLLWRSVDGTSWTPIDVAGVPAGYVIDQKLATSPGGGFLAIAHKRAQNMNGAIVQGALLLFSDDGSNWSVVWKSAGPEAGGGVAFLGGKWSTVVYTDPRAPGQPFVQRSGTSSDGRHWTWREAPAATGAAGSAPFAYMFPFRDVYLEFSVSTASGGGQSGLGERSVIESETAQPGYTRHIQPIPSTDRVIFWDAPTSPGPAITAYRVVDGTRVGPPATGLEGYVDTALELPQGMLVLVLDGSPGNTLRVYLGTPN